MEDEENERASISGAAERYNMMHVNLKTGKIDSAALLNVYQQLDRMRAQGKSTGSWIQWDEMGPDNVGGRVHGICIDRNDNNIIYAGGVSGGMWKSTDAGKTWRRVGNRDVQNNIVTCIVQGADGALYYGTGEGGYLSSSVEEDGTKNSVFAGRGVFKSTDTGATWTLLPNTDPAKTSGIASVNNGGFSNVHYMAADPSNPNKIYAGTDGGLYATTDGGTTWNVLNTNAPGVTHCKHIYVSKDGQTIFAAMTNSNPGSTYRLVRSKDGGQSFTTLGSTKPTDPNFLDPNSCSYVFAVSPQNENIIYVTVADASFSTAFSFGSLKEVYRSLDGGDTWTAIAKGDAYFNPLGSSAQSQGWYDNAIAVDPTNSDKVYIAGLDLWEGHIVNGRFQFTKLTNWSSQFNDVSGTINNPYYVHADHHFIIFDHSNPHPAMYEGTDGGVFKSVDVTYASSPTFFSAHYGMSITQFYGMGVSYTDKDIVIGGSQDNGVIKVNKAGITLLNGSDIKSGDGGYSEISRINPTVYFGEYVNGDISRSFNGGTSWNNFDDTHIAPFKNVTTPNYPFITKFHLWESLNDPNSTDTALFSDLVFPHKKGDTVQITSQSGMTFPYVLKADLPKGSVLKVKDIFQSKFFVGALNSIWMTTGAINPGPSPTWYPIDSTNIKNFTVLDMETTEDGNTLFASGVDGAGGAVYRITGLSGKVYKYRKVGGTDVFSPSDLGIVTQKIYSNSQQAVTGIGLDPKNPNNMIITLGGYVKASHVYKSSNAMGSAPTFTDINGLLPSFPVYDAIIDMYTSSNYFLATEYGVWASNNSGKTWTEENSGMERVPTFQLVQRKFINKPWNGPVIYAATHGRGIFRTETLSTGIPEDNTSVSHSPAINVYPNPASDQVNVSFHMTGNSNVNLTVFDIQGRIVGTYNYGVQPAGDRVYNIPTESLKTGAYFVRVNAGTIVQTSKFLISK
jgi:hypothetical protein